MQNSYYDAGKIKKVNEYYYGYGLIAMNYYNNPLLGKMNPEGERIIFISLEREDFNTKLYIINKDGTNLEEIELPYAKPYQILGIDW